MRKKICGKTGASPADIKSRVFDCVLQSIIIFNNKIQNYLQNYDNVYIMPGKNVFSHLIFENWSGSPVDLFLKHILNFLNLMFKLVTKMILLRRIDAARSSC